MVKGAISTDECWLTLEQHEKTLNTRKMGNDLEKPSLKTSGTAFHTPYPGIGKSILPVVGMLGDSLS